MVPDGPGEGRLAELWVSQLRKGLVEVCVLGVLQRGEAYGYAILKTLREIDALALTESTLYPALGRLTKEGLLSVRSAPSPDGPPRRYYTLTAAGRERLAEVRVYWQALQRGVNELLVGGAGR